MSKSAPPSAALPIAYVVLRILIVAQLAGWRRHLRAGVCRAARAMDHELARSLAVA